MTDEGRIGDPMDAVEVENAMRNLASGARTMFTSLVAEGFTEAHAIGLVAAWLHGMSGGKLS